MKRKRPVEDRAFFMEWAIRACTLENPRRRQAARILQMQVSAEDLQAGRLHALGALQNSSAYHCRSRHS